VDLLDVLVRRAEKTSRSRHRGSAATGRGDPDA